jgi:hypothetical protein
MISNITLQINISPGDINYAELTVTALVNQHIDIKNRLLVVDCCRPQKTKILDPDVRFPAKVFEENVEKIISISKHLLANKVVTDVYYIMPDDTLIDHLSKKYLRGLYKTTHGAGGTANMAYWAGIELSKTRYVLHYDGDIMLFQKPGFNWVTEAINYMEPHKNILIAIPRLCPPADEDIPSLHEGRPFTSLPGYWLNDWFSTRHFLCDKQKLESYLPLVRGKVMIELFLRKYGNRAFPIDPEILLFKSVAPRGAKRLVLKSKDAWLLHPVDKSPSFLKMLPNMLNAIKEGKYPVEQKGVENIKLDYWTKFLNAGQEIST